VSSRLRGPFVQSQSLCNSIEETQIFERLCNPYM
jgi:hypothetical protein